MVAIPQPSASFDPGNVQGNQQLMSVQVVGGMQHELQSLPALAKAGGDGGENFRLIPAVAYSFAVLACGQAVVLHQPSFKHPWVRLFRESKPSTPVPYLCGRIVQLRGEVNPRFEWTDVIFCAPFFVALFFVALQKHSPSRRCTCRRSCSTAYSTCSRAFLATTPPCSKG